ncbi:protein-L-isoaspartate O-methyltransferase family protein [Muricoccus radiodurans]|uniref:protein-L-isoaspartate O-methyltransferase family protein n=1 Tax=Muricoccus radiodurans TaxID=2231721 RepID=UPI003CE997EA
MRLPSSSLTRRSLLGAAGAIAGAAVLPARAAVNAGEGWTHQAFTDAMRAGGRNTNLTPQQFAAIQARRPQALARIERYLRERLGSADPAVMRAFGEVPREYYHYLYSGNLSTANDAYEADPKPWGLGYGSALSDYLGQAYMTQICQPKPGDVTLEIGTGSGFQSSLLSRIVARSYSIEVIEPLGRAVGRIFQPLGYDNVQTKVGDGYFGWPEVEGGFDIIIVTCAAQYAPPELFRQLKPGGRMIIPIGQPFRRGQVLYVYTKDAEGKVHSRRDVGVFFIPMTGAVQQRPAPREVPGAAPAPAASTAAPAERGGSRTAGSSGEPDQQGPAAAP